MSSFHDFPFHLGKPLATEIESQYHPPPLNQTHFHLLFTAFVVAGAASTANAAVNFGQPDWIRPASVSQAAENLTTFQHWDTFSSQSANAPDIASINPNGAPNAFDANFPASGSIVTSTGNLYAGSGIIRMNTIVPSYGLDDAASTRFLLQITTSANALFKSDGRWIAADPANPIESDFSRLLVNGQRVDDLPSFTYDRLYFLQGSSPTSFVYERAISFELPGNAGSYNIEWTAVRGSTSMAEIAVDTLTVVPEPASLGLFALTGLLTLRRRRA